MFPLPRPSSDWPPSWLLIPAVVTTYQPVASAAQQADTAGSQVWFYGAFLLGWQQLPACQSNLALGNQPFEHLLVSYRLGFNPQRFKMHELHLHSFTQMHQVSLCLWRDLQSAVRGCCSTSPADPFAVLAVTPLLICCCTFFAALGGSLWAVLLWLPPRG
jgi:hypothetical protein